MPDRRTVLCRIHHRSRKWMNQSGCLIFDQTRSDYGDEMLSLQCVLVLRDRKCTKFTASFYCVAEKYKLMKLSLSRNYKQTKRKNSFWGIVNIMLLHFDTESKVEWTASESKEKDDASTWNIEDNNSDQFEIQIFLSKYFFARLILGFRRECRSETSKGPKFYLRTLEWAFKAAGVQAKNNLQKDFMSHS